MRKESDLMNELSLLDELVLMAVEELGEKASPSRVNRVISSVRNQEVPRHRTNNSISRLTWFNWVEDVEREDNNAQDLRMRYLTITDKGRGVLKEIEEHRQNIFGARECI